MQKLLNYLIILLIGAYGIKLVAQNNILYYLHERYILFFSIGAFICLLVGVIGVLLVVYQHVKLRNHHHEEALHPKSFITNAPLIFFIIVGLLLPAKALTSATAVQRIEDVKGVTNQQSSLNTMPRDFERIYPSDTKQYSYNHWFDLFDEESDLFLHGGKEVKLKGFVLKHESFESDVFVLARFMITHCAVDARPVGFPVKTVSVDKFASDAWIEVTGKFTVMKDRENEDRLFIVPEVIESAEEPENPYLYPY